MTENRTILEHASQIGEIRAEMRGLREQQKNHAEQTERTMLTFNIKLDSILEYIHMQKGQKIAIIGIASAVAMFGTKFVAWVMDKLS